jgi:hypothetical protein
MNEFFDFNYEAPSIPPSWHIQPASLIRARERNASPRPHEIVIRTPISAYKKEKKKIIIIISVKFYGVLGCKMKFLFARTPDPCQGAGGE